MGLRRSTSDSVLLVGVSEGTRACSRVVHLNARDCGSLLSCGSAVSHPLAFSMPIWRSPCTMSWDSWGVMTEERSEKKLGVMRRAGDCRQWVGTRGCAVGESIGAQQQHDWQCLALLAHHDDVCTHAIISEEPQNLRGIRIAAIALQSAEAENSE